MYGFGLIVKLLLLSEMEHWVLSCYLLQYMVPTGQALSGGALLYVYSMKTYFVIIWRDLYCGEILGQS